MAVVLFVFWLERQFLLDWGAGSELRLVENREIKMQDEECCSQQQLLLCGPLWWKKMVK